MHAIFFIYSCLFSANTEMRIDHLNEYGQHNVNFVFLFHDYYLAIFSKIIIFDVSKKA